MTAWRRAKYLPGDSEKQVVTLSYDKMGDAQGEIVLPPLADPKHVYWLRLACVIPSWASAGGPG